jgi:RHS repeat-associated protein
MRVWGVLRQLLAATLCAVLALPACSSAAPLSNSTPSHTYDAATLSKTRVWGSNEKILLHFRAVLRLSGKRCWGCEERSEKVAVGSVVTYDYDAFGNLIHSTGTTLNNYLFAGEQFDPDLNLYYNRARYLRTSTGRFWNMDTEEGNDQDPLSVHKYLYAEDDAVNNLDPSGNEIDEVIGSLVVSATINTMPTLQFAPLVSQTRVEVHFDRLGTLGGKAYHHAYLLVRAPTGAPIVFRGGPSIGNDPNAQSDALKDLFYLPMTPPAFGYLTESGSGTPFLPAVPASPGNPGRRAAPDYPSGPGDDVASVTVPNVLHSFNQVISDFTNAAHHIEQLRLPYGPVHQNSNSFAHTLIVKSNLLSPTPPVWAPGWDNILY